MTFWSSTQAKEVQLYLSFTLDGDNTHGPDYQLLSLQPHDILPQGNAAETSTTKTDFLLASDREEDVRSSKETPIEKLEDMLMKTLSKPALCKAPV